MSLVEKVNETIKASMKSGDTATRDILRQVSSKAKLTAKEDMKRSPADREIVTDADMLAAIQKQVKQGKEAIELYAKAVESGSEGAETAQKNLDKEKTEVEILSQFLPKQMSPEEVENTIKGIVDSLASTEKNKMKGMVMKELGKYSDVIDRKAAAEIVDKVLSTI